MCNTRPQCPTGALGSLEVGFKGDIREGTMRRIAIEVLVQDTFLTSVVKNIV